MFTCKTKRAVYYKLDVKTPKFLYRIFRLKNIYPYNKR